MGKEKNESAKPKGGPLFDPTSHYNLKNTDYGPLVINNILVASSKSAQTITHRIGRSPLQLSLEKKLGFVLGTLNKPTNKQSEEYKAWVTYHLEFYVQ